MSRRSSLPGKRGDASRSQSDLAGGPAGGLEKDSLSPGGRGSRGGSCLSRGRVARMQHAHGLTRAALGAVFVVLAAAAAAQDVPRFEVDPAWPKQLPHDWILGQIGGIAVDANDHVWVVQRPGTLTDEERGAALQPPRSKCCFPAPPVLEFDVEGNLLRAWGGPGEGYEWPAGEHGVSVGPDGNLWLGGNGKEDAQLLKFTPDGKFLMQLGRSAQSEGSNSSTTFGRPALAVVDPADQRAVRRRRLRQPASDRPGRGDRRVQAALGRIRQASAGRRSRRLRSGPTARRAVSHPRALRARVARRPGVRLRPQQQPHPGVPARRQLRHRVPGRAAVPRPVRIGLRHRLLRGCAAELPVRGRWRQQRDPHPAAQHGRSARPFRPRRPAGGTVPLAAHDGGRLAGEPSIPARSTRASASRNSGGCASRRRWWCAAPSMPG